MFFTAAQQDQLTRNGLFPSQGRNHAPIAKLVLPGTACCWLIAELRGEGDQRRAYGLADHGTGHVRLGTVSLYRLEALTDPTETHRIQQEETFTPQFSLAVYARAASVAGHITEDPHHLAVAAQYCAAFDRQRAMQDEPVGEDVNGFIPAFSRAEVERLPF